MKTYEGNITKASDFLLSVWELEIVTVKNETEIKKKGKNKGSITTDVGIFLTNQSLN